MRVAARGYRGAVSAMSDEPARAALSRARALSSTVSAILENPKRLYLDPAAVLSLFERWEGTAQAVRASFPALLGDLPSRGIPESSGTTDHDGRGYIERRHLALLLEDIEYTLACLSGWDGEPAPPLRQGATPTAFLLMPFAREFDWLREDIAGACGELGVLLKRADDIAAPGVVIDQVRDEIRAGDVVVAVLTGRNPNVFYELGFAETLHEPVLVAESAEDLPFDVTHRRTVLYGPTDGSTRARFQDQLVESLRAVLESRGAELVKPQTASALQRAQLREIGEGLVALRTALEEAEEGADARVLRDAQARLRLVLAGVEERFPDVQDIARTDLSPRGRSVMRSRWQAAFDQVQVAMRADDA